MFTYIDAHSQTGRHQEMFIVHTSILHVLQLQVFAGSLDLKADQPESAISSLFPSKYRL